MDDEEPSSPSLEDLKLTDREKEVMVLTWKYTPTPPKIDFPKLSEELQISEKSTKRYWSRIHKKVTAALAPADLAGSAETPLPTAPPVAKGKKRKNDTAAAADGNIVVHGNGDGTLNPTTGDTINDETLAPESDDIITSLKVKKRRLAPAPAPSIPTTPTSSKVPNTPMVPKAPKAPKTGITRGTAAVTGIDDNDENIFNLQSFDLRPAPTPGGPAPDYVTLARPVDNDHKDVTDNSAQSDTCTLGRSEADPTAGISAGPVHEDDRARDSVDISVHYGRVVTLKIRDAIHDGDEDGFPFEGEDAFCFESDSIYGSVSDIDDANEAGAIERNDASATSDTTLVLSDATEPEDGSAAAN